MREDEEEVRMENRKEKKLSREEEREKYGRKIRGGKVKISRRKLK